MVDVDDDNRSDNNDDANDGRDDEGGDDDDNVDADNYNRNVDCERQRQIPVSDYPYLKGNMTVLKWLRKI